MTTYPIPSKLRDFLTYRESLECKGFLGIKNLFSIIRQDAKIAFKEFGISIPLERNKLREIQSFVVCFGALWNDWSLSTFCNLTTEEISVINEYRKGKNYKYVGLKTGLTEDQIFRILNNSIDKLRSNETNVLFQKWKDFKHFQLISKDNFLDMPLEGFKQILPSFLLNILIFFGSTMREVLQNVSIKELRKYRRFGRKTENIFKEILNKYDCLDLLN